MLNKHQSNKTFTHLHLQFKSRTSKHYCQCSCSKPIEKSDSHNWSFQKQFWPINWKTAWNFSPDYKSSGQQPRTPSDGGLQTGQLILFRVQTKSTWRLIMDIYKRKWKVIGSRWFLGVQRRSCYVRSGMSMLNWYWYDSLFRLARTATCFIGVCLKHSHMYKKYPSHWWLHMAGGVEVC